MTPPLVVNPQAEADLVDAKAWYDERSSLAGERFLAAVDRPFVGIQRTPELHAVESRGVRLALVKKFPFAVAYRIDPDQITVVAVYHTSRDPRGWSRRA